MQTENNIFRAYLPTSIHSYILVLYLRGFFAAQLNDYIYQIKDEKPQLKLEQKNPYNNFSKQVDDSLDPFATMLARQSYFRCHKKLRLATPKTPQS